MSDHGTGVPQGVDIREEMEQLPESRTAAPCQPVEKQSPLTIDHDISCTV